MSTRYTEGDVVATPEGRGVVAAALTGNFEFPQGREDLTAVTASDDRPAYVVGLERSGSAAYRASTLQATALEEDSVPVPPGKRSPRSSPRTSRGSKGPAGLGVR
jgi:hypothetical protein